MVTPLPVRTSWESEAAFSTTELPNPLPFTVASTGNTSLRYNFFKAEYEDLVLSTDLSIEKTLIVGGKSCPASRRRTVESVGGTLQRREF